VVPSRVRLTQEVGPISTGKINATLTLLKGQQTCVNTTAIIQVSSFTSAIALHTLHKAIELDWLID